MTETPKPSVTEQLQGLAALTNLTGGLHEAQLTQLRLYGLACSSAVKSCEVSWDSEEKEILYFLEVDPGLLERDFDKRAAFLKHAVSAIMRGWSARIRVRQPNTITPQEGEVLDAVTSDDR